MVNDNGTFLNLAFFDKPNFTQTTTDKGFVHTDTIDCVDYDVDATIDYSDLRDSVIF